MSERRDVRVAVSFFEDLDRQLSSERGLLGQPSSADFLSIDMLEIVEWFATRLDSIPPLIDGRTDYRVLVKSGLLVRGIEVIGVVTPDGSVELVGLELDLSMNWD